MRRPAAFRRQWPAVARLRRQHQQGGAAVQIESRHSPFRDTLCYNITFKTRAGLRQGRRNLSLPQASTPWRACRAPAPADGRRQAVPMGRPHHRPLHPDLGGVHCAKPDMLPAKCPETCPPPTTTSRLMILSPRFTSMMALMASLFGPSCRSASEANARHWCWCCARSAPAPAVDHKDIDQTIQIIVRKHAAAGHGRLPTPALSPASRNFPSSCCSSRCCLGPWPRSPSSWPHCLWR